MLVYVSSRAVADLLEACVFLGPSRIGEVLVEEFEKQLVNLRTFPEMGFHAHPLAEGARAVLLGRTGYLRIR